MIDPVIITIVILTVIFNAIDAFASEATKKRIHERLSTEAAKLSDAEPLIIIRRPLALCNWCIDRLCGPKIWSMRGLLRICLASLVVVVTSLGVLTWKTGRPLGAAEAPWDDFVLSEKPDGVNEIPAKPANLQMTDEEYRARMELLFNSWPFAIERFLNDPSQKSLHAALIILSGLLVIGLSASISWSISRKMLRKLIDATDSWDIWANLCLNVCLILVVAIVAAGALGVIVFPEMRVLAVLTPVMVAEAGIMGALGMAGATAVFAILALFLARAWFQTVVAVCLLPSLFAALLFPLLLLSFWWREPMHRAMNWLLGRMISFKSGPIAWSIRAVAVCGGILWLLNRFP